MKHRFAIGLSLLVLVGFSANAVASDSEFSWWQRLTGADKDPLQLFDVIQDPDETKNLASSPSYATTAQSMIDEIKSRYDTAALTERVLESQRRRALLKTVMLKQSLAWDYEPASHATSSYIRNNMPVYELEKRARFPSV